MNATQNTMTIAIVTDGDFENATEIEITRIREDDTQAHIEDSLLVNAIRGGKLVEVRWNDLTHEERQAAREAFLQSFEPSYYY